MRIIRTPSLPSEVVEKLSKSTTADFTTDGPIGIGKGDFFRIGNGFVRCTIAKVRFHEGFRYDYRLSAFPEALDSFGDLPIDEIRHRLNDAMHVREAARRMKNYDDSIDLAKKLLEFADGIDGGVQNVH